MQVWDMASCVFPNAYIETYPISKVYFVFSQPPVVFSQVIQKIIFELFMVFYGLKTDWVYRKTLPKVLE